jgi:acetyl-CoA carboxylase / biotin carboxylase 1
LYPAAAAFVPNFLGKIVKQDVQAFDGPLFMAATLDQTETSDLMLSAAKKSMEQYVSERGGNLPIKKVLIANNGMAATKCILSMRQWAYMELGDEKAIQFVAMATPEDMKANAEFIRLADEYVEVPGGVNRNNYANVDVITKIAQEQGVDAVWPGWGHASENPKLPTALKKMGIKFIGPTAPVMAVLGDKIAANILAQTANVPSIPWSGSFGGKDDGPLQADLTDEGTIPDATFEKATCRTVEEAITAAEKIGYADGLMIKASEGGGGKGIRFVDNEKDLRNAFIQVQNEVVGSPIFIMQLCKNARHLEVQIVGDEHGNAVALNGRDCSTQRRFQKIFEEGPPSIAKPASFTEMQKAAQRLTQSIGYVGAGTVEYLYNADTDKFFFLELNPRLQVEHPVTEGITGVNMPATQLQVAMGIPLYNIPQIRKLYGKEDVYGSDKIDFLEEDYMPIDSHVIAARITAENPDEGFKPTAGSIERVKFQSTPNVWGYFSVGVNGGIHEYADSQFGHVFAKGPTREQARRSLILALKEIEVKGDIRTTVEYLVKLLETKEFIENTIDTSWLDGIIKEKSVRIEMPQDLVVVSAAIYQAYKHVQDGMNEIKASFEMGQVSTGSIPSINYFPTEVAYLDTKYTFQVQRKASDIYRLTIGSNTIDAQVTKTADGALLATFGGETHRITGLEEPLGLRLRLDGNTIMMPSIVDPSEFRTDVTGKVVRYLKENGEDIKAGEPFVEIEAMKMIMPVKATEAGKITNALSSGSVIAAGDLLASIELKDPSKVKKIATFAGKLDIPNTPLETDSGKALASVLAGFDGDADAVVQQALEGANTMADATAIAMAAFKEFLRVENVFAGKLMDDVVRDLSKANINNLDVALSEILAHQQLKLRSKLILAMLRQVETFSFRFGEALSDDILEVVGQLASMEGQGYGDIVVAADMFIRESKIPSFDARVEELRMQLVGGGDLTEVAMNPTLSAGVDLLTYLMYDNDAKVRAAAAETYVRRLYRAHRMKEVTVTEESGSLTCTFSYQFSEVPKSDAVVRTGVLTVVDKVGAELPRIIDTLSSAIGDKPARIGGEAVNSVHLVVKSEGADVVAVEAALTSKEADLKKLGVSTVNLSVPKEKADPTYFTFPEYTGYKEDPLRRNMRPTRYQLLELEPLSSSFKLEQVPAIGRNNQVYIGTEKSDKPIRGGPQQVVFVRGISHSVGMVTDRESLRVLQQGLDELERARADTKVKAQSSSRIYLHSLSVVDDMSPEEIAARFKSIVGGMKSNLAQRLLKLNVDEIECKFRLASAGGVTQVVRLVASSADGEWLKATAYLEKTDGVTGLAKEYTALGDDAIGPLNPYATSGILQTKRSAARRAGSTYAYDFLGLMEVGLVNEWKAYAEENSKVIIPSNVFEAQEFLEGKDGELYLGSRPVGTNKVAMVAWLVNMKTPEYPTGRDVVVISNDVTVQSGSFGVEEDEVFFKASKFAREKKLPRVYLACNAGARIGLVDELKPKLKIKFSDPSNPAKGFEYLYISDEDYKALPAGSVIAHKTDEGWALDDVIGSVHGIGVENLQGSGKIAGETSRAYDEIFTLSYVTGRSVGIGAYLVRLGQRVIQKKVGPILLTGYSALNKLLGREVYNSQDQLGGPQIMVPNGVAHETVEDDQEGVAAILKWLSFVPKEVGSLPSARATADPVNRAVTWKPTPTPYDPRLMLTGAGDKAGFFDKGSFKEYLAGWGKSVVIGRGRLGGMPMGAIAVETRLVDKVVPADPADPKSREAVLPQAGTYCNCFCTVVVVFGVLLDIWSHCFCLSTLAPQDKFFSLTHPTRRLKLSVTLARKAFPS